MLDGLLLPLVWELLFLILMIFVAGVGAGVLLVHLRNRTLNR